MEFFRDLPGDAAKRTLAPELRRESWLGVVAVGECIVGEWACVSPRNEPMTLFLWEVIRDIIAFNEAKFGAKLLGVSPPPIDAT
jgi:hypothetical protein